MIITREVFLQFLIEHKFNKEYADSRNLYYADPGGEEVTVEGKYILHRVYNPFNGKVSIKKYVPTELKRVVYQEI